MLRTLGFFLICFFSLSVHAKKIARVHEVHGMSFIQRSNGQMVEIQKDFVLESGDLLFTSEESHLKVVDFYDREFLVSGESEVMWREEILELRKGNIWVVSNREESFVISTANSHTVFSQLDAIVSFDIDKGKTTLSVSDGNAYFNNTELNDLKVEVAQGQFSFVDKKYNNGVPRAPTILGGDSYLKLTKMFMAKPKTKVEVKESSRSIASIFGDEAVSKPKKGKIILIKEPKRSIASVAKKQKPKVVKKSVAPVRFFGIQKPVKQIAQKAKSAPASQQPVKRAPANRKPSSLERSFDQSLNKHFNEQKRHPSERLELIDELQSVSEDFQKEY